MYKSINKKINYQINLSLLMIKSINLILYSCLNNNKSIKIKYFIVLIISLNNINITKKNNKNPKENKVVSIVQDNKS